MKGSSKFEASTAGEIRILLREKVRSDPAAQKRVRHRLRQLGFFISDFASDRGPFAVADFDELVRRGTISIVEDHVGR